MIKVNIVNLKSKLKFKQENFLQKVVTRKQLWQKKVKALISTGIMALKTFKPYTKSNRGTVIVDKVFYGRSSLQTINQGQKSTGGRNNYGRTSRHRGGGLSTIQDNWFF